MNDLNVIDRFTQTFINYIESGFGLLQGEVFLLTTVIVSIDIVLAGLFWAFDERRDVIQGFIVKVLYVGFFALLLNNFPVLTDILFRSFGGLGIQAVEGQPLDRADLLRPGKIAAVGLEAAHPIMAEIKASLSEVGLIFPNWGPAVVALALFIAWLLVVLAFFILAIQLFVTIVEFKLTTLAGYLLVPFALWKKSAFLAERVLGNILSSGIKLMVLAMVIGIGSTFFASFTGAGAPGTMELEDAMVLVLAALTLVGLAIFVPGIAAGLISGAPQLGAGAAVGTALGVGMAGAGAVRLAAAGVSTVATAGRAAVKAAATVTGGAATAYGLGQAASGASGWQGAAAGVAGMARAGAGATVQAASAPLQNARDSLAEHSKDGARAAWRGTGGNPVGQTATGEDAASEEPPWAKQLRQRQQARDAARTAAHTLKDGDRPGAPANPSLNDED